MSGLFGATATQNKSPFSMFGGNNNNTNNQSTSGQQNQQTGSGLFGGSTNQQSPFGQQNQQSNTASLFGGSTLQGSQGRAQQASAPSLFGGAQSTQQPSQSLFGGAQSTQQPQQQSSQPQGGNSIFGGSLLNNNTANNGQPQQSGAVQAGGQPAQSNLGESRTSAHFDSLIERSRKRKGGANGASQIGDLPSLQLGLSDIAGKVGTLGAGKTAPTTKAQNGRARDLLAASGVPRGATVRDLNAIGASTGAPISYNPSAVADTDVESYVANLRAKTTQDLINESLEQTKREFNLFLEESIQMNWQEQRQRIHEHFGLAKPMDDGEDHVDGRASRGGFGRSSKAGFGGSFRDSGMSRSVLGGSVSRGSMRQSLFTDVAEKNGASAATSAATDPTLRGKQDKYAAKVRDLNISRKQGIVYPVIEEFAGVELDSGSEPTQYLTDAYRALKEITLENSNVRDFSDPGAVRERQYAKDYLHDGAAPSKALAMKKQILDRSKKFLEDQYFQQIETVVARNPQEANLGGVPSKINKVRAYLRIRAARRDLGVDTENLLISEGDYFWALLYNLLRCGLEQEAVQYVSQSSRFIKTTDRNFYAYISAFARDPERRLPRDLQSRINSEFSQRTKYSPENAIDPYRMACYKVIGRCDVSHKNVEGITMSMEDWLWLLFSLAREVNRVEESVGDYFGLDDLQAVIEQIGQRHFASGGDNGSSYATYFLMQIMSGLFEKAIAYLYPHNYVAAVHFAIALDFYGLLRVADFGISDSELLSNNTRALPQISFARMIGYYTQDFRLAKAESAADYLVLMCLNADLPGAGGESQAEVCQEALKELVLETREFALLLGDVQINGQKVKGAIEERLPLIHVQDETTFLHNLTIQAATVADDAGRTNDAVLLYHLAEEYDNVVAVLCRRLSDHVSQDLGHDPFDITATAGQQQGGNQSNPNSTLSLTTADNPQTLAENMVNLYNRNAMIWNRIRETNRDSVGKLLALCDVRNSIQRGDTGHALDTILPLGIVPLRSQGNITLIRHMAQNFNMLPNVVARCVGNLLVWTIGALGEERKKVESSAFGANRQQTDGYVQAAGDVMVFAGLIRYKLPADVFDMLARAGQSVGA